jgi:hypothetical protein
LNTVNSQSGQQYLPVYLLGPYRIIVTFIGVVIAFIFTIFPYPVTSKDILRQDIAVLFQLLSRMSSVTEERMQEAGNSDASRGFQDKRKWLGKVGSKCIAVHTRCIDNLRYASWEPNLQYEFPKDVYCDLLNSIQRQLTHWKRTKGSLFELGIVQNLAISGMTGPLLCGTPLFQSHSHLTPSLYHTLSGSLSLDIPLPPFLSTSREVSFSSLINDRLRTERELRHVGLNGYAVFAALEVTAGLASWEVRRCVELVRSLVGEVDLQ